MAVQAFLTAPASPRPRVPTDISRISTIAHLAVDGRREVLDHEHIMRDLVERERWLELMLTRLAPILAVAYRGNVHSAMFGVQISARSSFCTPASSRPQRQRVDIRPQWRESPPLACGHLHQRLPRRIRRDPPVEVVAGVLPEQGHIGHAGRIGRRERSATGTRTHISSS
jgi:hypothetical protein